MAEDSSGKWNYKLVSVICGIKSDTRTGCKKQTVQKLVFRNSCSVFHFAKSLSLSALLLILQMRHTVFEYLRF